MERKKEVPVYEPGEDQRLDFVYGYVTRSFRIKPEKWNKFLHNEENKAVLYDFFENPETMFILINLSTGGVLVPLTSFTSAVTTKSVYMMKKAPAIFTIEDTTPIKDALICGDLPPAPLEALTTFIEEVLSPAITSEVNQDKWPETVVAEVKKQTEEICSVLYTVQGQLKGGKTLLPMPVNLEQMEDNERRLEAGGPSEVDLELKTNLESLVIKWTTQINEVLQQDSSKPLKCGQNPSPYVEIAFWEDRVQDLECIYRQLNDDKVQRFANILDKTDSTYWPAFKSMFRNVVAALAEAQDILTHLKPLQRYLDNIQTVKFDEMAQHLEPLMQCVCLIWGHSRYYCSPARIIVLLQEICNLIIGLARTYVDGASIFQSEPLDGQAKSQMVVNTVQRFRDLYNENKGELPVYFSQETEAKNWDFLPQLVFGRYDKFITRMRKIQLFFDTSVEFYKLKSIDFGGNKFLSAYIADLHTEFTEFYQNYCSIQYDCSDPEDDSFEIDFKVFEEKVEDMDKRLSAVFARAFETCLTPESVYKLVLTLGALLDRPIIKTDFEQKYPIYVNMLDQNLATTKEMFDKSVAPHSILERDQLYAQYPPYSASIYWSKGMKERFEESKEQFKSLELEVEDKESMELLDDKHTELFEILDKMQEEAYSEWKGVVEAGADEWVKNNIFGTNPEDGSLTVNFKSELYATLKEVQYLQLAGYTDIPSAALSLYEERDTYRKNLVFLDQIAYSYNKILRNANTSERDVLKSKLAEIDKVLKEGKEKIKWSDSGDNIWKYVEKLRSPVDDLLTRFQKSQDNVTVLKKLVLRLLVHPLYERKDGKKDQLLALDDDAQTRKEIQYKQLGEMSAKVQELVANNKELLFDSSTSDMAWRSYLNYIDGIVRDALIRMVAVSMGYLADHTDPTLTPGPLLEVVMELEDTGIRFFPALNAAQSHSFRNLVEDITHAIYRQGALIERVKPGSGDYVSDIETAQNISEMHNDIIERVTSVTNQAYEYSLRFEQYAHIWEDDKKEYMAQFLKYGKQLTQEEIDAEVTGVEIPTMKPTLNQFREVIDKFEKLYDEVEKFVQDVVFDKWFRLNIRPFRQSLLNNCKRWSRMFKQFMIDSVVGGLQELHEFIKEAEKGLSQTLREGDIKTLISVMEWLQRMKERQLETDNMFDQVKQYIELLRVYDYEPPDAVFVQLDVLPPKWTGTKKLAIQVKHQAAPFQAKEVSSIRKRIAEFDKRQHEYRDKFKENELMDANNQQPYASIDSTHFVIMGLEGEFAAICTKANLFEVLVPEPKYLRMCPRELRLAKNIWDYIFIIESLIEDWQNTERPSHFSAEYMDTEGKRMAKEAKAMDKDVKQWAIFHKLEGLIKTMITIRYHRPENQTTEE